MCEDGLGLQWDDSRTKGFVHDGVPQVNVSSVSSSTDKCTEE